MLAAYQRQAVIVEKANKGKEAEERKRKQKAETDRAEKAAREEAIEAKQQEEDAARKARVKQGEQKSERLRNNTDC